MKIHAFFAKIKYTTKIEGMKGGRRKK